MFARMFSLAAAFMLQTIVYYAALQRKERAQVQQQSPVNYIVSVLTAK